MISTLLSLLFFGFPVLAGGNIPFLFQPSAPGPTITYLANSNNVTSSTSQSFTGTSFGTAAGDRIIVVGVNIVGGAAISSVTIGGVAASPAVTASSNQVGLYYALVPTGTSGTVAITASGAVDSYSIGVWRLVNYNSSLPYDSANANTSPSSTSISGTFDTPGDSVSVCLHRRIGSGGVTWTGVSESMDLVFGTNRAISGGTYTAGPSATSLTVTASYGSSTYSTLACASWR